MGATHRRKRPRATPLEDAAAPETGAPDAADASDVPDASDAASPGTLHTFDYFHDGASIRWVGPHGNGTVQSLPGPAPEHFSFPEGKLTGDGHVTERRASAIIKIAGTSLGEFSNFAYFGRTLPRDGTYAYFVGTKIGLPTPVSSD